MANLHLISELKVKSELSHQLRRFISESDKLLFIGNSVISLVDLECQALLNNIKNPIYVLEADVKCRGIQANIPENIQLISDETMVQLSAQSQQVISW